MRRPESSSCLLLPKSPSSESPSTNTKISNNNNEEHQLSVTVITTNRLPTYSAERYYILNEIEQHAYSIHNLDDMLLDDQLQQQQQQQQQNEKKVTSTTTTDEDLTHKTDNTTNDDLSSYILFYLLWDSSGSGKEEYDNDPNKFLNDILSPSVTKLHDTILQHKANTTNTTPNIYVLVDKVSPPYFQHSYDDDNNEKDKENNFIEEESSEEEHHTLQVQLAEEFARLVAKSKLRSLLQGITIGITSEKRAAPACEVILSTVSHASSKRRQLSKSITTTANTDYDNSTSTNLKHRKKSIITIITQNPDDLLGIQEDSTTNIDDINSIDPHGAQDVVQSTTCAEWNGNGNIISFAKRAQFAWKKKYFFSLSSSIVDDDDSSDEMANSSASLKKKKNTKKEKEDPMVMFMMIAFWIGVLSFCWFHYFNGNNSFDNVIVFFVVCLFLMVNFM